jgi:hypothetical protein
MYRRIPGTPDPTPPASFTVRPLICKPSLVKGSGTELEMNLLSVQRNGGLEACLSQTTPAVLTLLTTHCTAYKLCQEPALWRQKCPTLALHDTLTKFKHKCKPKPLCITWHDDRLRLPGPIKACQVQHGLFGWLLPRPIHTPFPDNPTPSGTEAGGKR